MAKSGKKGARKPRIHVTHSSSIVESQLVTPARIRAHAKKFPGLLSRVEFVHGDDPAELEGLLNAADYEDFLEQKDDEEEQE